MGSLWRSLVRITSFSGKELRETLRRPGMLIALVLGPFLIMLLFGLGYTGQRRPFATEVVIPAESSLPRDPAFYQDLAPGRIQVVSVTDDRAAALDSLEKLETDLVVVAPENAAEQLRHGEQTEILVAWNQVDPVYDGLARLAVSTMVSALNAEIIREAAAEGIDLAGGRLVRRSRTSRRMSSPSPPRPRPRTWRPPSRASSTSSVLRCWRS